MPIEKLAIAHLVTKTAANKISRPTNRMVTKIELRFTATSDQILPTEITRIEMRNALLILAYLIAAVPAIAWCIRHSSVHGVESTFTRKGLSSLLSDLGASPLVVFVVIPFAIAFWPLLCLMDLSEIPKKKRLQKQLQDSEDLENDKAEVEASNSQKSEMQIGKLGVTLGVLSPMGQVTIEGAVWNASSSSKFIADGAQVIVRGYRGSTLMVEQTGNN